MINKFSGSGDWINDFKKDNQLHAGILSSLVKNMLDLLFSVILKMGSEHYKDEDLLVEIDKENELITVNNNEKFSEVNLVVDDNDDLRFSLKNQFEELNFNVIESKNGKEALIIALSSKSRFNYYRCNDATNGRQRVLQSRKV